MIHDGLGYVVGSSIGLLYEDTGIIGSWDPEWIKQDLKVLIDFLR